MKGAGKSKILKNAFIISLGSFLSKVIGAIYRVPLTNILGGVGVGLYQMAFPVYCILLDLSGAGLPTGLSKIIAEKTEFSDKRKTLKVSLIACGVAGFFLSLLMALLSKPFSTFQGDSRAKLCFIALSPSVFFVSVISCFRGFFQGNKKMFPTAFSQVLEQVFKLFFGLLFAFYFSFNISYASAGATFAVTLSEIFALVFLIFVYRRELKKTYFTYYKIKVSKREFFAYLKEIVRICIPVTLIGIIIPLSQTLDSVVIINVLKSTTGSAISSYGLLSGAVSSLVGVPVAVCYGVAVSSLPEISESKESAEEKVKYSLFLTFVLSVVSAVLLYVFAENVTNILFSKLTLSERETVINLTKTAAFSVVFLSLAQTLNSSLIAKDKKYFPIISLFLGMAVKTVLEIFLLKVPYLSITGAQISVNVGYFVAVFLDLVYIIIESKKEKSCALNLKPVKKSF